MISIHAPREESDPSLLTVTVAPTDFNPRSPWGERRFDKCRTGQQHQFQSTLPVGGATHAFCRCIQIRNISIHAPRGGSDNSRCAWRAARESFQSTLPVGGATHAKDGENVIRVHFNPRSPWGERLRIPGGQHGCSDFNPRSPWGERLVKAYCFRMMILISIHAPRGGSDIMRFVNSWLSRISIHAPRGGSDIQCSLKSE